MRVKVGLLPKVIIAILLGALLSFIAPIWLVRIFVTISSIFSNFLSFIIPLLIIGLVAPGIAELGKGAGRMLGITVAIAYGSTVLAGFFSYFTTKGTLPLLIEPHIVGGGNLTIDHSIEPLFTIDMPPLMEVTTALILAFFLGLTISALSSTKLKGALQEFRDIINITISKIIIPLLPLYIFGLFLKIGAEGEIASVLTLFYKVILVIFVMHVALLLFQFTVAGAFTGVNPLKALRTMMPAYATALGTQSSAATIPVTLMQVKKLGVDDEVADFVVPLCATIHLSGSILKIVACAFAVMYMNGLEVGLDLFAGFIMMLGVTMVAAPGVPGGAIMAAVALLQSMLHFNDALIGLMITLYIAIDSFGTACNITGDGAISLIMNKINKSERL